MRLPWDGRTARGHVPTLGSLFEADCSRCEQWGCAARPARSPPCARNTIGRTGRPALRGRSDRSATTSTTASVREATGGRLESLPTCRLESRRYGRVGYNALLRESGPGRVFNAPGAVDKGRRNPHFPARYELRAL